MAVGSVTKLDFVTVDDPTTGRPVTRLTPEGVETCYPYFTQPLFDGDRLLVASNAPGSKQLFLLDTVKAEWVQLTDLEGGIATHQPSILPGRGQAGYIADGAVWRVDLETGRSEELFKGPDGHGMSILSPTADGSSVTFAASEKLQLTTQTGWQYSAFHEHLYRRPNSIIIRVDTETGEPQVIWGENEWISHVVVSPANADDVVFCHEGPWDRVHRLWRVKASNGAVTKLLDDVPLLSSAGHEFFTDSGLLGVQFSRRLTATARDWVRYNCLVDADGHNPRFWRYPAGMPCHFQAAHQGDQFVGDRAYPSEGYPAGGDLIAVMRHLANERVEVTPLCHHDTSWKDQPSHPHPVFSPDDTRIYFNSDRTGQAAVYRVGVPD